jgi:hypothetical protein
MARIELKHVYVAFPLSQSEHRSLKRVLSNPLKTSRFGTNNRQRMVLRARSFLIESEGIHKKAGV